MSPIDKRDSALRKVIRQAVNSGRPINDKQICIEADKLTHAELPTWASQGSVAPNPDFARRWNELVKVRPVDLDLVPGSYPAYSDPVFIRRFDETCEAARSLIERGATLTYVDLFRRDKDTGLYWWKRLLMGAMEWMVPKSAPVPKSDQWDEDDPPERKDPPAPKKKRVAIEQDFLYPDGKPEAKS